MDSNASTHLTDYEAKRQENIARNRLLLASLDLDQGGGYFAPEADGLAVQPPPPPLAVKRLPTRKSSGNSHRKASSKIVKIPPTRTSRRLRGHPVGSESAEDQENIEHVKLNAANDVDSVDVPKALVTFEEYFPAEVQTEAIKTTGHFTGWVNKTVQERYSIEGNAADAWEKNGGGKFTFKTSGVSMAGKPAAWSNAKYFAYKMLRKNPNAYFYRLNEDGEEQWTGDWTEEEQTLFLQIAKTYGCGDKWGLFASHIPHRVGYQCSNYYRSVILPAGLIRDPNYLFARESGTPVFIGKSSTGDSVNMTPV